MSLIVAAKDGHFCLVPSAPCPRSNLSLSSRLLNPLAESYCSVFSRQNLPRGLSRKGQGGRNEQTPTDRWRFHAIVLLSLAGLAGNSFLAALFSYSTAASVSSLLFSRLCLFTTWDGVDDDDAFFCSFFFFPPVEVCEGY